MDQNKKKRGRKPKNNIIINENPKFDQDKINDIVASLNISKHNNVSSELIIDGSDSYKANQLEIKEENKSLCWNCSNDININISFPINYINNIFYLNGNFCSYECAGRYIFDNYHGKDLFKKYSLLNLYYNETCKTCKKVNIAPEKIYLKKFGGKMDYSEYINNSSTSNIQNIYLPPSIYINNQYYKKQCNEDSVYKMYRKKNLKTNSLFKDIEKEENNENT
jgi:hypothetical protein